jgi:hypothetical protein
MRVQFCASLCPCDELFYRHDLIPSLQRRSVTDDLGRLNNLATVASDFVPNNLSSARV